MHIQVTRPFNFQHGPSVVHYAKGLRDVPETVAHYALERGFAVTPTPKICATRRSKK